MNTSGDRGRTGNSAALPSVFLDEQTLSSTTQHINQTLASQGWIHLQGAGSTDWFEAISARLGEVLFRADVIVDPAKEASQQQKRSFRPQRPSSYQHDGLQFHTDAREWNILGFYCVEQDRVDGASRLLDVGDLDQAFSLQELECLAEVEVCHLSRDPQTGAEKIYPTPLVTRTADSWLVFYAPWLLRDTYEPEQSAMLERFRSWLQKKEERCAFEVRLKPGEALFLNNNRVMHARKPIEPTSRRHLVRTSINTGVLARKASA